MDQIHEAQDRDKLPALVNVIMKHHIHKMWEISWLAKDSFSF